MGDLQPTEHSEMASPDLPLNRVIWNIKAAWGQILITIQNTGSIKVCIDFLSSMISCDLFSRNAKGILLVAEINLFQFPDQQT